MTTIRSASSAAGGSVRGFALDCSRQHLTRSRGRCFRRRLQPRAVRGLRGGRGLRGRGNLDRSGTGPPLASQLLDSHGTSTRRPRRRRRASRPSCAAALSTQNTQRNGQSPAPTRMAVVYTHGHKDVRSQVVESRSRVFYAPAPAFGDHAGRVSKVAVNRIFASPATLVSRSPESSRNGRCRSSSTAVTS